MVGCVLSQAFICAFNVQLFALMELSKGEGRFKKTPMNGIFNSRALLNS